jgi:hypothetical protein
MIEPLFNGNIAETFWKTDTDNIKRNYGYQYDAMNCLTNSIYQKNNIATNSHNEKTPLVLVCNEYLLINQKTNSSVCNAVKI